VRCIVANLVDSSGNELAQVSWTSSGLMNSLMRSWDLDAIFYSPYEK